MVTREGKPSNNSGFHRNRETECYVRSGSLVEISKHNGPRHCWNKPFPFTSIQRRMTFAATLQNHLPCPTRVFTREGHAHASTYALARLHTQNTGSQCHRCRLPPDRQCPSLLRAPQLIAHGHCTKLPGTKQEIIGDNSSTSLHTDTRLVTT